MGEATERLLRSYCGTIIDDTTTTTIPAQMNSSDYSYKMEDDSRELHMNALLHKRGSYPNSQASSVFNTPSPVRRKSEPVQQGDRTDRGLQFQSRPNLQHTKSIGSPPKNYSEQISQLRSNPNSPRKSVDNSEEIKLMKMKLKREYNAKVEALESQFDEERSKFKQEIRELDREINRSREVKNNMRGEIDVLSSEKDLLIKERDRVSEDNKNLLGVIERLKKQVVKLEKENASYVSENEILKEQYEDLKSCAKGTQQKLIKYYNLYYECMEQKGNDKTNVVKETPKPKATNTESESELRDLLQSLLDEKLNKKVTEPEEKKVEEPPVEIPPTTPNVIPSEYLEKLANQILEKITTNKASYTPPSTASSTNKAIHSPVLASCPEIPPEENIKPIPFSDADKESIKKVVDFLSQLLDIQKLSSEINNPSPPKTCNCSNNANKTSRICSVCSNREDFTCSNFFAKTTTPE
ncbi:hypothetical protein G210_5542 [Candida maltosa Xu316]|uniref:Uncharacterized protein n=1 Tax=Candida maltosa (strain Xu316) TaxID=1245528 RepID=M3HTM0_CANMX|nr:hypothetical protein G210_5542 [Candida maltosa Xu316]